jgi:D-glycero-alpha-D-manno-heptose-7-phosphate kinase
VIVTRSPLRVSLGGGGTDLPSYYERSERGGFLVALAIRRHVYVTLQRTLEPGVLMKWSQIERVERVADIRHPILREALLECGLGGERALEVTSVADIPAGTGLGSSGAFATALLQAIAVLRTGAPLPPQELAELACRVEIGRIGDPVGKQDQYVAAFGGLTALTFPPDGPVVAERLAPPDSAMAELRARTLLFFTGRTRSAAAILREQDSASRALDPAMRANLDRVREIGLATRDALLAGDVLGWGRLMREHWEAKKRRSAAMTNPRIEAWMERGLRAGAVGGKLVGAGGGGFLLFVASDPERLRAAMAAEEGLRETPLEPEPEGTSVLAATP